MTLPESGKNRWVGKNVVRREDLRLLLGRGRFVDDIELPRMAHAALLPSPYAHARILRIDTSAAKALPGVLCVMTGAEVAMVSGPLPSLSGVPVPQHCIAVGKVRHVGEPVAVVAALDRYIAEDALALIEVEYEELPVQADMKLAANATGDGLLHPELGTNLVAHHHYKWGPVDEAYANAAHVVRRSFRWPRVGPQPIETSGAVASFDPADGKFTIWSNLSMPATVLPLLAGSLQVAPHQVNFPALNAGGSFGGKVAMFHAPIIAAVLARAINRPVKYVEDRLEHMTNGNQHASDRIYEASLAVDANGLFTALHLDVIDDYGAYFQLSLGSHGNALAQATGPYRIPALEYEVRAVLTNKTQQAPYRGFGGEVGNFVIERLVDAAAVELGIDRIALRKANYISPSEFPYRLPHGNIFDSGDYVPVLTRALELANMAELQDRKTSLKGTGKRLGIGISAVNERSVLSVTELWFLDPNHPFPISSTPESVQVRIDASGSAVVTIYAPNWGNSPETMVVQLVAEYMSMTPDRVNVMYGDTDSGMPSVGPAGSRYTTMIAGAIAGATRALKSKMLKIASHVLGGKAEEFEVMDETVRCIDQPERQMSFSDISTFAHSFRLALPEGEDYNSGLVARYTYDHPHASLPNADRSDLGIFYPIVGHAVHVAVVEIDEETRKVEIVKYVAVHDAGTVVNPKLIDGQIRGGIAQGIGTALYEQYHYDENGQLSTASLADYMIPTASEVPDFIVDHLETPSPYTEFGIKGCGEGGRLASIPAIASAIDDAFSDVGLFVNELPMTPSRLHDALSKLSR
jgi:CO/xanthine dehydrogenase Mo-binding subunit